jgi:hypothetical protein
MQIEDPLGLIFFIGIIVIITLLFFVIRKWNDDDK